MTFNPKIEKGIEKFIRYIRNMNQLTDQQLEILLSIKIADNRDYYTSLGIDIPGHIQFIRQKAKLSDDYLRSYFRKQIANNDLTYQDIFENADKRKAIRDLALNAKAYKTDPKTYARKVDKDFRR